MVSSAFRRPAYFKITAFTGDNDRIGPIGGLRRVACVWRHNLPSTPTFTINANNRRADDLAVEGTRVVVDYLHTTGATPVRVSGVVSENAQSGPGAAATRTFTVRDDFEAVFNDILGWPNPTGTILQQGDEAKFYTLTGAAETVVKQLVAVNAIRLGIPITVPATDGHGTSITITTRMHRLYDRLFPAVDQAGIGVRVVQTNAGERVLQVYVPTVHPVALTEASGAVIDPQFTIIRPTASQAVVGAGGEEGVNRPFRIYVDAAIEATWGFCGETFVDAQDIDPEDVEIDFEAAMQTRGLEALTDAGPRSSVAITAAETNRFRFGDTFQVGDRVTVKSTRGPELSDYVREVHGEWTPKGGMKITPTIGDWADSKDVRLYRLVALALKGIRDVRSSR